MEKRIYLDYAASTPIAPEVLRKMMPYLESSFGNPNSVHAEGKEAAKALRESRQTVAGGLGASSDEVVFTGSGTEANNIAIMGVLKEAKKHISGIPHMVVSSIEHSSVLTLAKVLAEEGVDVDFCRVGQDGIVDLDELASLLRDETILVSVMYVNNEIGTIEPIGEVARIIKEYKQKKGGISAYPLLHTDAAQAPLYLEVDVGKLGADLLTIDAQKIYGPKGAGALYIRKGVRLEPIFFGGGQEKGIRPSTQNVAGIVGLAEALRIAGEKRGKEVIRLRELQQYFFERIKNEIPQAIINGSTDQERRVPNNVNISIPGVEGDYLAVALDSRGVATSSASACSSSEASASHVVRAISEGDDRAESAIRFTMGRETKKEDINIAVEALKKSLSSFGIK